MALLKKIKKRKLKDVIITFPDGKKGGDLELITVLGFPDMISSDKEADFYITGSSTPYGGRHTFFNNY
jgi:hypothetical protein